MLIIGAQLETYRSLKDRTLKLSFETQEPTPEQLVAIVNNAQKFGYLAFKEDAFKQQEKDQLEQLESEYQDKGKSPSKRLKNVLYVNWQQDPQGYEDFNRYYDFHMEKMITHWKSKLD